jgi:hypothetical protein
MLARTILLVTVTVICADFRPAAAQEVAQNYGTRSHYGNYSAYALQDQDPAARRRVNRNTDVLNQEKAISEYTTPYQYTRYYGYGMYRPWLYEPNFAYWYGTNYQPYKYRSQEALPAPTR